MSDVLDDALAELDAGGEAPAYLLAGQEFLVRKAAETLLAKLVPGGAADLNVVIMDAASPREVAAELATMPMFGGRKVVYLRDPDFIAPKKGKADALNRPREQWKANRRKEAARRVLNIAARAGWGVAELSSPRRDEWERDLGIVLEQLDVEFLAEVAAFCAAEGLTASSTDDGVLIDWLSGAPAKGQVLVIAASEIDGKHPLVKLVKDKGRAFEFDAVDKLRDFKGNVDAKAQAELGEFARSTLAPHKKTLGNGALELLIDRVGGNFRLLQSELTKLALYSDGATITKKDVDLLVGHAREDEFFELTDAISKRDFAKARQIAEDRIVGQDQHALMLLGSVSFVLRGMLNSHERVARLSAGRPPRNYNEFQSRVWPKLEAEFKATKARVPHPFKTFKDLETSLLFGRQNLLRGLVACAEADLAMKTGGAGKDKGYLVFERLLWAVCGKAAPWEGQMHVIRREKER